MTFDSVKDYFANYLNEDTECEVILTKHGYTVLVWDNRARDWDTCEYCGTPEMLLQSLIKAYKSFAELKITGAMRNLTRKEKEDIEANCKEIAGSLYNLEGNKV